MSWEIPVIRCLRNTACKLGRWPTGQHLLDQPHQPIRTHWAVHKCPLKRPYFREFAPTTEVQLTTPLSTNSKKCSFRKSLNVKVLQKSQKLVTFLMYGAISCAVFEHSSPSLTNEAYTQKLVPSYDMRQRRQLLQAPLASLVLHLY